MRLAHDPPKCERFGDKIMRQLNNIPMIAATKTRIPPARGHFSANPSPISIAIMPDSIA